MTLRFAGRAALITGASSGIGRSIAQRLGEDGMECWLVGRSAGGLTETASAISAVGGRSHCCPLDVATPGALAAVIAGVNHPHLLAVVNCAGVMYPEAIIDADPARWRELFNVNVLALLEGSQAAVHKMRALKQPGHIVNFSSLTARWDAGGVYGATKIAVEMITRTLRKELERDIIRVTTIVPGGFVSELGRGFPPAVVATLGEKIERLQVPFDQVLSNPVHIANLVAYILDQPTEVNLSEVVIRPPVSLEY